MPAPSRAATQHRSVASLALVLICSLAALGCGPTRRTVPLDSPEDRLPPPAPPPAPREVEPATRSLIEEDLPPTSAPPAANAAAAAAIDATLPFAPPSLLDSIDARTPPNVAAAIRLTDAARTKLAAGDSAAALEQLERAIAIDSSNPYAYYYLAELHFSHRTFDQTIAFADRAAVLSAARAPQWASRAWALQGNAYEAAGRFADARAAYARALGAAPGNLAAQVGLARVGGGAGGTP